MRDSPQHFTLPKQSPQHLHQNIDVPVAPIYCNTMCYHALYIFTTCGHSLFTPPPLLPCSLATLPSNSTPSSTTSIPTCHPRAHPYRSKKLDRLCAACHRRRTLYLQQVEEGNAEEVKVPDWKWRVAYRSPAAEAESWRSWGEAGGIGGSGWERDEVRRRREEREENARRERGGEELTAAVAAQVLGVREEQRRKRQSLGGILRVGFAGSVKD